MSDAKIELDRTYTVPLSRAWIAPRYRRTNRVVNVLKEFAEHHMKSSEIKIDSKLNEMLWSRGITKPPRRITVRMTKDEDGLVTISLPKPQRIEREPLPELPRETTPLSLESDETTQEGKEGAAPQQSTGTQAVPASAAPSADAEKPSSDQPASKSVKKKRKTAKKDQTEESSES